jgi:hypothetical protein
MTREKQSPDDSRQAGEEAATEIGERQLDLTVITGLSGAGKSEVVATFEDMGYFCIDNLPPQMLPGAVQLFSLEGSRVSQVALVFDARGGSYFEELGQALEYLRRSSIGFRLLYLAACWRAIRPAGGHIPFQRTCVKVSSRNAYC